jgi:hypothetical protein
MENHRLMLHRLFKKRNSSLNASSTLFFKVILPMSGQEYGELPVIQVQYSAVMTQTTTYTSSGPIFRHFPAGYASPVRTPV